MKIPRLPFAFALLAPFAAAQDGDHPAPNPNDPAYEPLKAFVGNWDLDVRQGAKKSTATETFELVCNGLFLKSVVNGTWEGKPFQGISIWGYDPKNKHYVNIWADSMSPVATKSNAKFDAATKTWSVATVSSPQGPSRSVMVWKDANTIADTTYAKGPDGKETVVMEITHKRATAGSKPSTTAASTPLTEVKVQAETTTTTTSPAVAPAYVTLHQSVGTWDSVMTSTGADGKTIEDKGTEVNSAVCNGLWVWSDYNSTFMGQKFEGHGLVGYDPSTKAYTNYWIDSMTPFIATLTGTFDDKTKTMTCSGKSCDPAGNEMPMAETHTWTGDHSRVANFTCGTGDHSMKFSIAYKRSQQIPGHKTSK